MTENNENPTENYPQDRSAATRKTPIISRRSLVSGGTIASVGGLLGVAAIRGSSQEGESANQATPDATPGASPQASPQATPASETEVLEFTIVMGQPNELEFEPNVLTIPANTEIILHLPNEGIMYHDFHIRELAISTPLIDPGESTTVVIKSANPGEYEYYCNVEGHRESGMVGTLIVE